MRCDASFGRETTFLDAVASLSVWYYAQVPHDTRVGLQRPETFIPAGSGRGRKPIRRRLAEGEPLAQTVVQVAKALERGAGSYQMIQEGSQGPMRAFFAGLRVIPVRDGLPGADSVWLVLRRNGLSGQLKADLCNAPEQIPQQTRVKKSGMRWPIETRFEGGVQLLGLGDYEVRTLSREACPRLRGACTRLRV